MARILLTWELGAGFGHLTRLRPVVKHLSERGHQVHLAVRNLSSVDTVFSAEAFSDEDFRLYQAPITVGKSSRHIRCPIAFSHILHNCGFANEPELRTRIKAWAQLYEMIDPEIVIFDHSPTALAAARGLNFSKVVIGSSFTCPPNKRPLPSLQPWQPISPAVLLREETHTVNIINEALKHCGKPVVDSLSGLYHDTDLTFLTTFKELDHFGERPGVRYYGAWPTFPGEAPDWPNGTGKRIFAYLKRTSHLSTLLDELKRLQLPTLVYGNWVTDSIAETHGSPTLRLVNRPLDLQQVAAECDLAILNGTHGATAAMLLGGTPTLQLPIYLEQHLVAHRAAKLGAATIADGDDVLSTVMPCLRQMLASEQFAKAARRFSEIYARVQPKRQFEKMMDGVESRLPKEAGQRPGHLPRPGQRRQAS